MYMKMYISRVPRRYSLAQARAALPEIVDLVEAGAEVEIARRGELVAVVLSPAARAALGKTSFSDAYEAFLAKHGAAGGLPRAFARRLRDRSLGRGVSV